VKTGRRQAMEAVTFTVPLIIIVLIVAIAIIAFLMMRGRGSRRRIL
jgi:hypothetical protein